MTFTTAARQLSMIVRKTSSQMQDRARFRTAGSERSMKTKLALLASVFLIVTPSLAFAQSDRVIGNTANTPVGSIRSETVLVNRDGTAFVGGGGGGGGTSSSPGGTSGATNAGTLAQGQVVSADPTYAATSIQNLNMSTNGHLRTDAFNYGSAGTLLTQGVATAGAASLNVYVGGSVTQSVTGTGAAGTPATGVQTVQGIAGGTNVPTLDSCTYMVTLPTLTDGQTASCQANNRGIAIVNLVSATGGGLMASLAGQDGTSNTANVIQERSFNEAYNGSTWDMVRSAVGAYGTVGTGLLGDAPSMISGQVTASPSITASSSGVVAKASAGNAYSFGCVVAATGTAGWCILNNTTTVPTSGATLTPCALPAAVAVGGSYEFRSSLPKRCSVGATVLFSSSPTVFTPVTAAQLGSEVL